MILSVVSGTYNRLGYLEQMVNSVRESMGRGLPYEIVLVDGGSTDGTIPWCRAQPDVKLIEQGQLLGAIAAFNAGAFAAEGRYVLLANDDVEFLGDSLLESIAFMQDHPDVGIGCFDQDRGHPDRFNGWEYMPAVLNGEQVSVIYGQVCIVPRWLGNRVGWWGNAGMRTYGGDNELSCNVMEHMGYKVVPLPCCCIQDLRAEDELRRINTQGSRDGDIWGAKWTRILNGRRMTGPIIQTTPQEPNPLRRLWRYLYMPIYEGGHEHLQHVQKRGLRDALARYGLVYEFDYVGELGYRGTVGMRDRLEEIFEFWNPDLVLSQIHSPDEKHFTSEVIQHFKRAYPRPVWLNWNGDYHPQDLFSDANIRMAKAFNLQLVVTTQVAETYRKDHVNWRYWQIGWEDESHGDHINAKQHDIVFLANGYSPQRIQLGQWLRGLPYDVGLYGSWPERIGSDGNTLYDFTAGADLYRKAKIALGDDQFAAPGYVSNRLFQAMHAGGALYLAQRVPALEDLLGIRDGEHYVAWDNVVDLGTKLAYWLNEANEAERAEIAARGQRFVHDHHSFDARVREMLSFFQ